MTPRDVRRGILGVALCSAAVLLASLALGQATGVRPAVAASLRTASPATASGISLQVSVGYQNIYRGTSWTPVRVTLRNDTNADVGGLLEIPQSNQSSSVGASPAFHGLYQAPVTLPAGGTKRVTVYVPGSGVQGHVAVTFRQGNTVLATGSTYPTGIDSSALLIGVLASTPSDSAWVAPGIQQQVTTHVVHLSAATFDPVAQALGALDIIVLTNVDTSQLDRAQLQALEGYVRNGGSLLLVGGPAWQETLRPLPAALLPGTPAGMRILPNLDGLRSLGAVLGVAGSQSAAVSVLSHPSGTVRAGQAGVPLVIRKREGEGAVEYLAFDPAVSPVPAGSPVLEHLVAMAAPLAITRTWAPQGFRARFEAIFRSLALTNELANLPAAVQPLLAIFAGLALGYVLLLGPANFLVLRWIGRQHLAWITLPALGLLSLGSMVPLASHFRGTTAMLNSVGLITLDGSASARPAIAYLSLATPLPGDYQLAYAGAALPAALPQLKSPSGFFPRNASTLHNTPLGLEIQEDPQTNITFLSMPRWSTRDLTLDTSVDVPGALRSSLTIDAQGDVVGSIHNGTNLDLLNPVVVAGRAIAHLSTIPAGATVEAHVRPGTDNSSGQDPSSYWSSLYGSPDLSDGDTFGGGFRYCCDSLSFPSETALLDRERNAIAVLSQAQVLPIPRDVLLVGWSERPLGTFTVDGAVPHRRSLSLIVAPLAVQFPSHGPFRLTEGTLAAHLVDITPRAPQSSCCFGFGGPDRQQQLSVGTGGSLTFEFDLPGRRQVRFRSLTLSTGSGEDSLGPGQVYDWRASHWVDIDLAGGSARLSNPNRFVSPYGQILVELRASTSSGDLTISDQYHAIDLSGEGMVT